VLFEGRRIDTLSEKKFADLRKYFGFLFQLNALFDSMTAGENVAFPILEQTDRPRSEIDRIVEEKLHMVGLSGIQNRMPAQLSGGQKKRVALARALALDPGVILYDEPTTGLDPIRADVINSLIRKLQHELHVTSVVVTHDMASAYKVADRVIMLYGGRFIFDGTCEEIRACDDPRVHRFIEGHAVAEDLAGVEERE
jgi:phospholipid/cholesterol/gamma-HCH transport system ATP-binding protein